MSRVPEHPNLVRVRVKIIHKSVALVLVDDQDRQVAELLMTPGEARHIHQALTEMLPVLDILEGKNND